MICTGEVHDMYWGGVCYVLGRFMICTVGVYDMYWGGV